MRTLVDADPASQEEVYQRYLGPQLLRSSGLRPLELAMARIGWQTSIPDDRDVILLRLVVVPPDIAGRTLDRHRSVYRPDQRAALCEALEALAQHFLPLLSEEHFADHLKKLNAAELPQILLKGERPLAKFDRTAINKLGGTISSHLVLTLSDPEIREQVEAAIRKDHAIIAPVEAVASDDPYRARWWVSPTQCPPPALMPSIWRPWTTLRTFWRSVSSRAGCCPAGTGLAHPARLRSSLSPASCACWTTRRWCSRWRWLSYMA
ncbi:MAG: hypothetical protein HZY76_22790 [Anaerolineae bacterium]|nr:MAG: hypothetical protein HZY76_22790 [Anaerolineae bacterium]